jgi:hypothetical protein
MTFLQNTDYRKKVNEERNKPGLGTRVLSRNFVVKHPKPSSGFS